MTPIRISILIVGLWLWAAPIQARQSALWPEVDKIDDALRQQKWKPARKQTRKLAAAVVKDSWNDIELDQILAELAFQQAAASANLGDQRAAVWSWHIAQNLDLKIARKDLTPYGAAGKLLREFRLRSPGKVPAGFKTYPRDGNDRPPGLPKLPSPRILTLLGLFRLEQIGRLGDIEQVAAELQATLGPEEEELSEAFVTFINEAVFPRLTPEGEQAPRIEDLQEMPTMVTQRIERIIKGLRLEARKEYEQIGIRKGEQIGIQKGELAVLRRQLERKFGEHPSEAIERLERADVDLLLEWSDRVLTAKKLSDVVDG